MNVLISLNLSRIIYSKSYFLDQDYNEMRAIRALERGGGNPQAAAPSGVQVISHTKTLGHLFCSLSNTFKWCQWVWFKLSAKQLSSYIKAKWNLHRLMYLCYLNYQCFISTEENYQAWGIIFVCCKYQTVINVMNLWLHQNILYTFV